jgi:alpha-maltose-1-phosphate synthase
MLSAATVFICPSVYGPLGIANLEATARATAVMASGVAGITGSLAHYDPNGHQGRLADAVNSLIADPEKSERYGQAGRQRCIGDILLGAYRRTDTGDLSKVCT